MQVLINSDRKLFVHQSFLFVGYDPNGLLGKSVSQSDVPFARHMQIIFYGFAASVKAVIQVICVDPCEVGV